MRYTYCIFFLFLFILSTNAQNLKIKVGQETAWDRKMNFFQRIIQADQDGCVFFHKYFDGSGPGSTFSYSLQKFDNQGNLLKTKVFDDKKLSSFDAIQWIVIDDKIYLFERALKFKEKALIVNMSVLSLTDFSIQINAKQLFSTEWSNPKYPPNIGLSIDTLPNKMGFGIIVDKTEKTDLKIDAYRISTNGQEISKTSFVYGNNEKSVSFENAFFNQDELHIITKVYKTFEAAKKRNNFDYLANYTIGVYDYSAKKIKDIEVSIKDKFITAGKLYQFSNTEYIFTAFYTNKVETDTNDGLCITMVNTTTSSVTNTSFRETTNRVFNKTEKEKLLDIGSDYNMIFKALIPNPKTGGFLLLTEEVLSASSKRLETNNASVDISKSSNASAGEAFKHQGIVIAEISRSGSISWITRVSKNQYEIHRVFGDAVQNKANPGAQLASRDLPYHTSFSFLPSTTALYLIFNDHPDNASITTYTPDEKEIYKFDDAQPVAVEVNYLNGKLKKRAIDIGNSKEVMSPKTFCNYLNTQYVVSWKARLFQKPTITVTVISTK